MFDLLDLRYLLRLIVLLVLVEIGVGDADAHILLVNGRVHIHRSKVVSVHLRLHLVGLSLDVVVFCRWRSALLAKAMLLITHIFE